MVDEVTIKTMKTIEKTKSEDRKRFKFITQCRDKSMSYQEIGELLNLSKQRVYSIYRYGITNYKTGNLRYNMQKRDSFKCFICDSTSNLVTHNLQSPRVHKLKNILTLCSSCHAKIHKLMKKEEKRKQVLESVTVEELKNPVTFRSVKDKLEQIDGE